MVHWGVPPALGRTPCTAAYLPIALRRTPYTGITYSRVWINRVRWPRTILKNQPNCISEIRAYLWCIGVYPLHLGVHPALRRTSHLHCGVPPTLQPTPPLHCNAFIFLPECRGYTLMFFSFCQSTGVTRFFFCCYLRKALRAEIQRLPKVTAINKSGLSSVKIF